MYNFAFDTNISGMVCVSNRPSYKSGRLKMENAVDQKKIREDKSPASVQNFLSFIIYLIRVEDNLQELFVVFLDYMKENRPNKFK